MCWDVEFTGFDVLDLLAVPADKAFHRRIARQHQRQDGGGTFAHDVRFAFALAFGRCELLSRRHKPLPELLRQRRQQQRVEA